MIPILYPKDRKNYPLDFMDNGLGLLAHSVKCEVTEERNGPLELELEQNLIHFQNGKHQLQWRSFNSFLEWFFEL